MNIEHSQRLLERDRPVLASPVTKTSLTDSSIHVAAVTGSALSAPDKFK